MAQKKEIKNIGPSVREKLLKIAKQNNLNYDSVLLQYFQERFLYYSVALWVISRSIIS